jgi:hypothetical protein
MKPTDAPCPTNANAPLPLPWPPCCKGAQPCYHHHITTLIPSHITDLWPCSTWCATPNAPWYTTTMQASHLGLRMSMCMGGAAIGSQMKKTKPRTEELGTAGRTIREQRRYILISCIWYYTHILKSYGISVVTFHT